VLPNPLFQAKSAEFWAAVKLVSQLAGYSTRKTKTRPSEIRVYDAATVKRVLRDRGLDPVALGGDLADVVAYSECRAKLLNDVAGEFMDRAAARTLFAEIKGRLHGAPGELVAWNKQKGDKRHEAYLTSIVNLLTYEALDPQGKTFAHNPRGPLTFAMDGKPLRTLFRWMDGAYPTINHPHASWEIKEYYGTTTFGSRVADGVYETALDGYELDNLREACGIEVKHYLFVDDRFTWWGLGKSYLCRIVDMLHSGLVDQVFFGREVLQWPTVVKSWP
jgi:hypothetical protein